MASTKFWVWLATRRGVRPVDQFLLLRHFGSAEAVYLAEKGELTGRFELLPPGIESLCDKELSGSEQIMATCDRMGVRIMTWSDGDFPERLKQIADPPIVLYIRGSWRAIDEQVAIGVVGSRNSSSYGIEVAQKFGTDLAKRGAVVISGIAQGVDAMAVHSALAAGGYAISVLANGVDVVYPPSSAPIYEDLAARGALVSEYPPGTQGIGAHFPVRNRLISGLSLGVLVVEAATERSGALITARYAAEQNRDCFAVPGAITAANSVGANRLLRDGLAMAVTSVSDILREYEHLYPRLRREPVEPPPHPLPENTDRSPQSEKTVDKPRKLVYISLTEAEREYYLTADQQKIIRALEYGALTLDELVDKTGCSAVQVTGAITYLELEEYVVQTSDKRYYATLGIKEK